MPLPALCKELCLYTNTLVQIVILASKHSDRYRRQTLLSPVRIVRERIQTGASQLPLPIRADALLLATATMEDVEAALAVLAVLVDIDPQFDISISGCGV